MLIYGRIISWFVIRGALRIVAVEREFGLILCLSAKLKSNLCVVMLPWQRIPLLKGLWNVRYFSNRVSEYKYCKINVVICRPRVWTRQCFIKIKTLNLFDLQVGFYGITIIKPFGFGINNKIYRNKIEGVKNKHQW